MRPANHVQREARYNALLDAGARCIAEHGYMATRTADICLIAQMSAGNLFHYFPSKQALLLALIAREGQQIQQEMEHLLQEQQPLEALMGFLLHLCQLAEDPHYTGLALEIAALSHRDPQVCKLARHNDLLLREGLAALVRQANDLGLVRPGLCAEQIANWLAVMIDGLFARVAVDPQFAPQAQGPVLQELALHLLQGNRT
ncbi:TetR/AcrR family transcriptional regulator [Pseudomonas sessilinigenes]|uniref:TetR/AcrR family transcriptional regulator n=1 Tax=Pseudomonas sessilinigenes TaxID=658629 RepID=A0ABX8MRD2_9PSED|nr:TetR/AcrR family transcriptional regulator [Pseudomonas sessilinigenes]AZC22822.1 Transcriptional regulator, AcrR family [Pseudomonas sessilinigenes]QXH41864.1 TetR/AcrR family transcriptional regulator [Pseudomonas sessilinigenes]